MTYLEFGFPLHSFVVFTFITTTTVGHWFVSLFDCSNYLLFIYFRLVYAYPYYTTYIITLPTQFDVLVSGRRTHFWPLHLPRVLHAFLFVTLRFIFATALLLALVSYLRYFGALLAHLRCAGWLRWRWRVWRGALRFARKTGFR